MKNKDLQTADDIVLAEEDSAKEDFTKENSNVTQTRGERSIVPLWIMQIIQIFGVIGVFIAAAVLTIQVKQLSYTNERRDQDRRVREATLVELSWTALERAIGKDSNQGQTMALQNLADLVGLRGSVLNNISFLSPNVNNTDFRSIAADNIRISGGKISKTDFTRSVLHESRFREVSLNRISFLYSEFVNIEFVDVSAEEIDFSGSTSSRLLLDAGAWPKTLWHQAILLYPYFRATSMRGANFSDSLLAGAIFDEVDLKDADFTGAILVGVNMKNSIGLQPDSLQKACSIESDVELEAVEEVLIRRYDNGFPSLTVSNLLATSEVGRSSTYPKGILAPPPCEKAASSFLIYFKGSAKNALLARSDEGMHFWQNGGGRWPKGEGKSEIEQASYSRAIQRLYIEDFTRSRDENGAQEIRKPTRNMHMLEK